MEVPLGTSTVQGMAVVGGASGCMVFTMKLNNFYDDDVNYFLGIHHPRNFGVGPTNDVIQLLTLF